SAKNRGRRAWSVVEPVGEDRCRQKPLLLESLNIIKSPDQLLCLAPPIAPFCRRTSSAENEPRVHVVTPVELGKTIMALVQADANICPAPKRGQGFGREMLIFCYFTERAACSPS